jgi:hypothetical protein
MIIDGDGGETFLAEPRAIQYVEPELQPESELELKPRLVIALQMRFSLSLNSVSDEN